MTRSRRLVLIAIALLTSAAVAVARMGYVGLMESESVNWHAKSSSEAQRRGLLVTPLTPKPAVLACNGDTIRVTDAWVEPRTRVEYRFYLLKRLVRDSTFWVVVNLSPDYPEMRCDPFNDLRFNGGNQFDGYSVVWSTLIRSPIGDTLRLEVVTRR